MSTFVMIGGLAPLRFIIEPNKIFEIIELERAFIAEVTMSFCSCMFLVRR